MSKLRFAENSEPSTPASGKVVIYVDSADSHFKQKDDAGNVIDLAASSSGVAGPTVAVDEDIATFDGTTGLKIKDSGLTTTQVTANTAHITSDGTAHANVVLNDTHRGSDGSDHSFIDQDVTSSASPTFDGANITGVDAVNVDVADTADYFIGTNTETILAEIGEIHTTNGYDLLDDNSVPDIAFDNGTRTFSVSVKSGESSFHFWVNNKKVIKTTTQSIVIPDTTGTYYIVFDNTGTLQYVLETAIVPANFYENAITGLIYWNATANTSMAGDERHGMLMDARTHHYNHATYGARYESGLDITGLVDGNTTYTNHTSGYFWDEDIRHALALQSTAPFIYRLGAAGEWTGTTPDNLVGFKNGTSNVVWNEWTGSTWQLTESGSSTDYMIYFTIATPDLTGYNIKKIIGQNGYSSRANARNAIENEINNLVTDGLPSPEFIFLQAWIVRRNGDLENLADGSTHLDLRTVKGGASGASGTASLAADVTTNVGSFNTHLSSADTNVQLALDTLDDHTHTASQVSDFDTEVSNNSSVSDNTAKVTYPGSADATELNILDGATLSTTELNYVKNVTSAIQTQLDDKNEKDLTIDAKTANYTVVAGDNNKILHCSNSITITFPDSLDTGVNVTIVNIGTGTITLSAATTLNTKDSLTTITSQYGAISAYHAGSNVWYAYGDLA